MCLARERERKLESHTLEIGRKEEEERESEIFMLFTTSFRDREKAEALHTVHTTTVVGDFAHV